MTTLTIMTNAPINAHPLAELPLSVTDAVATLTGALVATATGAITIALMVMITQSQELTTGLAIIAITVAMYTVL